MECFRLRLFSSRSAEMTCTLALLLSRPLLLGKGCSVKLLVTSAPPCLVRPQGAYAPRHAYPWHCYVAHLVVTDLRSSELYQAFLRVLSLESFCHSCVVEYQEGGSSAYKHICLGMLLVEHYRPAVIQLITPHCSNCSRDSHCNTVL